MDLSKVARVLLKEIAFRAFYESIGKNDPGGGYDGPTNAVLSGGLDAAFKAVFDALDKARDAS